jgi:hypothetical protein
MLILCISVNLELSSNIGAPQKHRVIEHQQPKHQLQKHRLSITSTVYLIEFQ